mmetsp:Transcript_15568/g.13607  ORF Transcript_15568/g.13607 Transcript_15568/m.13607 type:complete len:151 (-) Transcript_15568:832-1284(-)
MPSEFKELWNEVVTENLIELPIVNTNNQNITFSEYLEDYSIFIPLVQTSFDILIKITQEIIEERKADVWKTLNLINHSKAQSEFSNKFSHLFKQFSSTIFSWSEVQNSVMAKYCKMFKDACSLLGMKIDIEQNNHLNLGLEKLYKIVISM